MAKPFDPLNFLDLAYALGEQTESEAHLRAAAGRAYYAMFLTARGRLGIRPSRKDQVETLSKLKRAHYGTGEKLGRLLGLRTEADYHLTASHPGYVDWVQNWARAKGYVEDILPRIRNI